MGEVVSKKGRMMLFHIWSSVCEQSQTVWGYLVPSMWLVRFQTWEAQSIRSNCCSCTTGCVNTSPHGWKYLAMNTYLWPLNTCNKHTLCSAAASVHLLSTGGFQKAQENKCHFRWKPEMRFIDVYIYLGSSKDLVCAGDHFCEAAVTSSAPSSLTHNHWSWASSAARTNESRNDQLGHPRALRESWTNKQNIPCLTFTPVFIIDASWTGTACSESWLCSEMGALSWVLGVGFVIQQGKNRDVTPLSLCLKCLLTCTLQGWEISSGEFKSLLSCLFFSWHFCLYSLPTAVTSSNICYEVKSLSVVHRGEEFHGKIHRNQCRGYLGAADFS